MIHRDVNEEIFPESGYIPFKNGQLLGYILQMCSPMFSPKNPFLPVDLVVLGDRVSSLQVVVSHPF